MPVDRVEHVLRAALDDLVASGRAKGAESVIIAVRPAEGRSGPRYLLAGEGERAFLRFNSNGYLGMALNPEVIAAEEESVARFGAGPQAVRFISGTYSPHIALEQRLAAFHGREAVIAFSSAYATVMGVLSPLITEQTAVLSDELNHNSIINAIRLARPLSRAVYGHGSVEELRAALDQAAGSARRAIIVTDGVFSMRGDHAPLAQIRAVADEYDARFPENVLVVVDDSHGVGALGRTGRGTEEVTGARADLLIATLGKAFGVNGGYLAGSAVIVQYLRETAPFYVYSNPITPGEAAAAGRAVELLDSAAGTALLDRLRENTARFRTGLVALGYETIPGEHPIVPLLVRDSDRTAALVRALRAGGVLATGLGYPVVPRGSEEIRFQIAADHTSDDIDEVLALLATWRGEQA
ncbi:MAG: aminotransferase class I/II-fold pyridoxal phosphate-dependent enzyme [Dehalococcoidia bacterium]